MNALEKLKLSKELRSLLGGMDGLKAMEKLKAAKRVRELVALLGGGSGQSNNEMEYAIKIAADSLDQLRKSDVYRVLTENPENIRAALATYIKNGRPDLAQEVDEVLQELDETADAQTPSNPLYQSVIDGAEITLPLIEQVIEEAEKNGDDANPQLAQAVAVVEQWATAQGWERAILDSLYAALFGHGGGYDVYGVA